MVELSTFFGLGDSFGKIRFFVEIGKKEFLANLFLGLIMQGSLGDGEG